MDEPTTRFGKLWTEWDARVAKGERPVAILEAAKDEDLIEILAGESRLDRKYARDIIATEILNRLHSRSMTQHTGAQGVEDSARNAHEVTKDSQEAIHNAEGILKASGEFELGASVSASADASLHATKAAFDSAQVQASALHETLGQSRAGTRLSSEASEKAMEASEKADEGREVTRELEKKMTEMGRGKEGRAASEASRDIQRAAAEAARDSAEHDADERAG